jgi:hypothetical protein
MVAVFLLRASLGENRPAFPGKDGGRENLLNSQWPKTLEKWENSGPGKSLVAVADNLSAPNTLIQRQDFASQEREGRQRGIQSLKPTAEGGTIRHAIGIFHRRSRRFPGTAFDKVAPQRLTAGDQAVMRVGKRKHGQEGNSLLARSADTAPNRDPVMVFVMSLLSSAAMTNDRIPRAQRAPANYCIRASLRPIDLQLALRRGK